ncbi:MAG TPA: septal ring lytic transglycosylase RlpA family protein [Nevskiaceae bacterium]
MGAVMLLGGCSALRTRAPAPSGISAGFEQTGEASWYGAQRQGRLTASGQPYDMYKLTAASMTLPLMSRARVTNLDDGRSVVVLINDRGPNAAGRIIDLSYAAAQAIGMVQRGVARVRVTVLSVPG